LKTYPVHGQTNKRRDVDDNITCLAQVTIISHHQSQLLVVEKRQKRSIMITVSICPLISSRHGSAYSDAQYPGVLSKSTVSLQNILMVEVNRAMLLLGTCKLCIHV